MAPINSQSGPVAVTGAAGYIGSHLVKNLVEHGYTVRACVRDKTRVDKTAHLEAMNEGTAGTIEIVEADMLVDGSYDDVFAGCCAVFHVAADIGTDSSYGEIDPERMYTGLFEATQNVLDSIEKAGTVERLVYTSSCAAVMGPAPPGHEFTEADWAGAGPYETLEEKWKGAWTIEKNAYAVGKVECEKMTYRWGDEKGVEVITSCPNHVIGPLLAKAHDTIWQHRLGEVFCGRYSIDMLWNITDVRDVAASQRLMAESPNARNGSRYINASPTDGTGELTARELVESLQALYPEATNIGGTKEMTPDRPGPLAKTTKAEVELGLRCYIVNDTLKDTIDTLDHFGALDEIRAKMAERQKL